MENLGIILLGKNTGVFINNDNEYCHVSRFYIRNKQRFQIVFSKGTCGEIAKRPVLNTTSEKKVLKVLTNENFKLV